MAPDYMTPKSDEDRLLEKIDKLIRSLYYKPNKTEGIDNLCLLKGRICDIKSLPDKKRKAELATVEEAITKIQLSYA